MARRREILTEEHVARVAANYPGSRIGEPDDIVALINFLCSEAASHRSGTVITVHPPRSADHADYDPRRKL